MNTLKFYALALTTLMVVWNGHAAKRPVATSPDPKDGKELVVAQPRSKDGKAAETSASALTVSHRSMDKIMESKLAQQAMSTVTANVTSGLRSLDQKIRSLMESIIIDKEIDVDRARVVFSTDPAAEGSLLKCYLDSVKEYNQMLAFYGIGKSQIESLPYAKYQKAFPTYLCLNQLYSSISEAILDGYVRKFRDAFFEITDSTTRINLNQESTDMLSMWIKAVYKQDENFIHSEAQNELFKGFSRLLNSVIKSRFATEPTVTDEASDDKTVALVSRSNIPVRLSSYVDTSVSTVLHTEEQPAERLLAQSVANKLATEIKNAKAKKITLWQEIKRAQPKLSFSAESAQKLLLFFGFVFVIMLLLDDDPSCRPGSYHYTYDGGVFRCPPRYRHYS